MVRGRLIGYATALQYRSAAGTTWLVDSPKDRRELQRWVRRGVPLFCNKIVERSVTGGLRVLRENPPMPFARLRPDAFLDTEDLVRHFECSLLTVYRWISKRGLNPTRRIGRELFFKKRDVLAWEKKIGRPLPGRPKRRDE